MKKNCKKNAMIFSMIGALVFSLISFEAFSQNTVGVEVGNVAPAFSVMTTDGKVLTNENYKGKAVLLHFWGTWCPPCRAELPHMNEVAERMQKNQNSKIAFVGVAVSDTPAAVTAFMSKNKYTFTGGLDGTNETSAAYKIQAVPTSILINADGKIERVQMGAMTKDQLEKFVGDYL